jgi:hypothetical protein
LSGSPTISCGQHIGADPDTDQDRLVLLDERFERSEVIGGFRLLGDDHHVAAVDVHIDRGDADAVDQQRALAADELDGVAGERLEMGDEAALGLVHELVDFVVGALGAKDQAPVTGVHAAFMEPHACAVLDLLEDLGTGFVDQRDAVGDQHLRAEVGVATGDRRGRVHDRRDVRLDERIGGDPVEVERVDDDDVTRANTLKQPIDVAVNPGRTGDARP